MNEDCNLKLRVSTAEINSRLDVLADKINCEYAGDDLTAICVLKGSFIFFSDLVRRLTCRPQLDFIRIASYGKGTVSKHLSLLKDLELSLEGRRVLIVEDIVDTGRSIDFLMKHLSSRNAIDIKIASLIDKPERRIFDVHVDFRGFEIPSGFLVGYGLDYAEKYRELPAIYELEFNEKI